MLDNKMSRRQFLSFAGISAAAVAGLGLVGCGGSSEQAASGSGESLSGSISCSGATSFQPLVEAAANDFMDANPDVSIAVLMPSLRQRSASSTANADCDRTSPPEKVTPPPELR